MHPDNAGRSSKLRTAKQDQSYSDDALPCKGGSETSNLCMEQCQIGEEPVYDGQRGDPLRHTLG